MNFRVDPELADRVEQAAIAFSFRSRRKVSASEWIREIIAAAAEAELERAPERRTPSPAPPKPAPRPAPKKRRR